MFDRKNLLKLLSLNNVNVNELAKKTNIPQPTLHQLCSGLTLNPREKTLKVLAAFFNVSLEQISGHESLYLPQEALISLPLLDWNNLNDFRENRPYEHRATIYYERHEVSEKSFALEMKGDSMEPIYPSGSILIFDSEKRYKNKDYCLIYLRNLQEFRFKKLLIDDSKIYITSLNPGLGDEISSLNQNDEIIATLVEARIKHQ